MRSAGTGSQERRFQDELDTSGGGQHGRPVRNSFYEAVVERVAQVRGGTGLTQTEAAERPLRHRDRLLQVVGRPMLERSCNVEYGFGTADGVALLVGERSPNRRYAAGPTRSRMDPGQRGERVVPSIGVRLALCSTGSCPGFSDASTARFAPVAAGEEAEMAPADRGSGRLIETAAWLAA